MNVKNSVLLVAAIVAALLMGLITLGAYLTMDPAVVQLLQTLLIPAGMLLAIFSGLTFASYVASEHAAEPVKTAGLQAPPHRSVGVTFVGFLMLAGGLAWLGNMVGTLAYVAAGIALVLAIMGLYHGRTGTRPASGTRYVLVAGAFVGGLIPGLILWYILSLVVSDRYCQLTSSKCL